MFCPICGNKIDPTKKFCENCGSPINAADNTENISSQASGEPIQGGFTEQQTQPVQPVNPNPDMQQQTYGQYPQQPPYQQQGSASFDSPQQQYMQGGYQQNGSAQRPYNSFSGTMPITNGNRADNYYSGSTYPTAVKKGSPAKKIIIIAVIAFLVAVIGVTAFFLIRKKMDRDFIVNNPTKSTLGSYQKYIEENESGNPFYSVLKDSLKNGNIKLTLSGSYNQNGDTTNIGATADYSYSIKDGIYYMRIDAADMLSAVAAAGGAAESAQGGLLEFGADPDNVYFNYDLFGSKGKYYIDNKNFRSDMNASIFSPDKDNVLGLDKEGFENLVSAYEKALSELEKAKDSGASDSDIKAAYDNLIKSIETNGGATVEDGTAELKNGTETTSVSADVITYKFDKKGFKAVAGSFRDEVKNLIDKTMKDNDKVKETKEGIDRSFEQFLSGFESSVDDNFNLTVKIYLDKNTHEAVKNTLEMTGIVKDKSDRLNVDIQFFKAPNNLITLDVKALENDTEHTLSASLKKTDDGNTMKYGLDINYDPNNNGQTVHASLEYNRGSGDFSVSAGASEQGAQFTYKGKALISGNTLSIELPDIVNTNGTKLSLKLEYSNTTPGKIDIGDAKNLLKITKDEFEQLTGRTGSMLPGLGGSSATAYNGYEDYDDGDFDFDYDLDLTEDDYDLDTGYSSAEDAGTIDMAVKSYYSGIKSGTINKSTDSNNSKLPKAGAAASERSTAADNSTVLDALKYSGLNDMEDYLYNFGADKYGKVYSIYDDDSISKITVYLYSDTKLSELYGTTA